MSKTQFEHLFSPLQVGPMRVPNRICETTNTINSSMIPGEIDENFRAHHGAKARGGTGWIGSETWLLNLPFPPETPDEIGLSVGFASHFAAYQNPAFAEGMKKFCDEVHEAGAVAVIQLTHLSAVWAPSPVPVVGAQDYTPHALGDEEIEFCLNTYADAAAVAKDVGADGIEIHCAHETLCYSFLSPVTNRRTDQWGGGPQERIRFVVEVLERVRKVDRQLGSRWAYASPARSFGRAAPSISKCARCSTISAIPACSISWTSMSVTAGVRLPMCRRRTMLRQSFAEVGKAARTDLDHEDRRPVLRAHQRPRCGGGADQGRVLRSGGHGASGYRRPRIRQQGARGPFDGDTPLHRLHSLYRRGGGTRDLSLRADLLHQSGRRQ